jgi:hypothetical protein
MLLASLLVVPAFASDGTPVTDGATACSTSNAHPETGGYYIVGLGYKDIMADEDPNDPSTYGDKGQKADDYEWNIPGDGDTPYPDAQPKLCTSYYGCASDYNVLAHHTCAILRFAYAADSGSTVYKMKNNDTFQACDFTDAELIAEDADALPNGEKYTEYPFEQSAIDQIHYFASQSGCTEGQKVAVLINADYADTYDACYGMGTETSRIQHCDCDHQLKSGSLTEVCGTGFIDGCMSEMPSAEDQLSCCPGNDATYENMAYTNGGNCIAKSQQETYMHSAKVTRDLCSDAANQATCDSYLDGDCPWWRVYSHGSWTYNTLTDGVAGYCPSYLQYGGRGAKMADIPENYGCDGNATEYTPTCDMWFMKVNCDKLAAGETVTDEITESSCGHSLQLAAYNIYTSDTDTWDAWLESRGLITAAPTTAAPETTAAATTAAATTTAAAATTAAATTEAATTAKPIVDESFATHAVIGLILAVLS